MIKTKEEKVKKDFNQNIERMKHLLEILKAKETSQKDLEFYRKLAYYTIGKVVNLFLGHDNKEAEKVLAKALDCDDGTIKFTARSMLLEAERMGRKLHKRTLLKLKKTEEEMI